METFCDSAERLETHPFRTSFNLTNGTGMQPRPFGQSLLGES